MYLPNYRLCKTWLNKGLKHLVSEHPLTVNTLKGAKHCQNLHNSTFIIFFITPRKIELENICLSHMWNLRTVHDNYSFGNSEYMQPIKMQLSNKKNFCLNLCWISKICIKFWTFWKQDGPHNWCISKIRRCERHTAKIYTRALSSYFSITLTEIELENVSLSDIWNLRSIS